MIMLVSITTGTKEKVFLIPGATHIQTYYVPEYKLATTTQQFFGKYFKAFYIYLNELM